MKKILFICIYFAVNSYIVAQQLLSGNYHHRLFPSSNMEKMDNNGEPCVLVHVNSDIDGLTFINNVVSTIETEDGYDVYLWSGCNSFTVKLPYFASLKVGADKFFQKKFINSQKYEFDIFTKKEFSGRYLKKRDKGRIFRTNIQFGFITADIPHNSDSKKGNYRIKLWNGVHRNDDANMSLKLPCVDYMVNPVECVLFVPKGKYSHGTNADRHDDNKNWESQKFDKKNLSDIITNLIEKGENKFIIAGIDLRQELLPFDYLIQIVKDGTLTACVENVKGRNRNMLVPSAISDSDHIIIDIIVCEIVKP